MSLLDVWYCIFCGEENEQLESIQCEVCKAYRPRPGPVPTRLQEEQILDIPQTETQAMLRRQTTGQYLHWAIPDHNELQASVEAAYNELVASQKQQKILEDTDDGASIISTTSDSLDSVFSVESSDTLATALSRESGFSSEQIERATQIFVNILLQDPVLIPFYEVARNGEEIGHKRFERHVRGAIKTYAGDLKDEANDHLEFAASRLVHVKARVAARCVASSFEDNLRILRGNACLVNVYPRTLEPEDSSEDEAAERPLDATEIEDLEAFRRFLMESNAYATLQARIRGFFTKYLTTSHRPTVVDGPTPMSVVNGDMKRTWRTFEEDASGLGHGLLLGFERSLGARAALFLLLDAVFLLTDDVFISLGWLEPSLRPGWTRIRSDSSSGDRFFDDFIELRTDGMKELVQEMRQSLPDFKITAVSYNYVFAVQRYTTRVSTWLHHISSSILLLLPWHDRNHTGLPRHNISGAATTTNTIPPGSPQQQLNTVHLMTCVHRNRKHPALLQTDIHTIRNDQALFTLLRSKIAQRRNRLLHLLSCRSIQGIFFTKFHLHSNDHVDIRDHKQSCPSPASTTSCCDCLPPIHIVEPFPNAEYRCDIPCPPGTWPPVGSNILLLMLKSPDSVDKKSTWILHRAPKRVVGELSANSDHPLEGWGFYFQEGWDFDLIITISFVVFVLGSLLFGICWSVLEHDIQGAFGVSAYMVTACGLFVAFVVSKTG